jgi:ABC-type transport system involved in cytochrome c biogenesis permease subunit
MIDPGFLISLILHLLPMLYAVAFFDYLLVFITEEPFARRLARPLLVAAVTANVLYFVSYSAHFAHIPLVNVFQVMGGVGFAVAVTYLLVESRTGTPHTGPFILGLVLIFQIVNTLFPKLDRDVPEILRSTLFSFHVSVAVLGYSAFAVAAVYGVLYLLQYRVIRNKTFGLLFQRLPSLDILDRMNVVASAFGFVFLTVAIIAGTIWSHEVFGGLKIDPKVLVAVLTWALYGLALAGRQFVSWKGPRMAYSSVLGFAVVLFSMFAVNFFLSKFHVFVS